MAAMTFFLPGMIWAAAAFRPERNPEITQALVDLGWLLFITPIAPFIVQYVTLAIAIFADNVRGARVPAVGRLLATVDQLHVSARVRRVFHETRAACMERPIRVVDTFCGVHRLVLHHDCSDPKGGAATVIVGLAFTTFSRRGATESQGHLPRLPLGAGYPSVPVDCR